MYTPAVSAGFYFIARDPSLLGLSRKVTSISTYGVNMVQADLESAAELAEPNFLNNIKAAVDTLGIRWALHGEIGESMALETALEQVWKMSQRRVHQYLDILHETFIKTNSKKYVPEFIDFHVSNLPIIGFMVERWRYAGHTTVDFKGRSDWSKLFEEEPKLKAWFVDNIVSLLIGRERVAWRAEEHVEIARQRYALRKLKKQLGKEPTKEELEKAANALSKEEEQQAWYEDWLEDSATKHGRGSIVIEEMAYALIARYLEIKKNDSSEPLWKLFFKNKSLEDLEKSWNNKMVDKKKGEFYLDPDLTAMVSCRYILGHFQAPPLPEYLTELGKRTKVSEFNKRNALSKLKEIGMVIVFENPEIKEGQMEGLHRILHANHMYNLVKAAGNPLMRLLIDFEHYVHNGIDPLKEIEAAPEDFGKYVKAVHLYAPTALHVHSPIYVGSEDQRIIYSYLYALRKKGFKEGVLVFERGGGKDPGEWISTSIESIRMIIENLEKDLDTKDLPLEFFGISPKGVLSPQRQEAIIKEHALDPLKGMLSVPEEEYTFLSSEAIKKGKKPEEWKKEEYR